MKIEIRTETVETRSGTAKSTGKPYTTRKQTAYMFRDGEPYPDRFEISLGDLQAFKPGMYALGDEAFKVGQYGDLELDRFNLKLLPIADKPPVRAAG